MLKEKKVKKVLSMALAVSMGVVPTMSYAAPWDMAEMVAEQEDQYGEMTALKAKWKELLTGSQTLGDGGSLAADYAESIDELAGSQWNAMIKLGDATEDERTCLFADLPMSDKSTKTGSSQITLTFDRLKAIALAYETPGSQYYGDEDVKKELTAALSLMIRDHYSMYYVCGGTGAWLGSGNHSFGNWYDWRIGTPRQLCDLLLMFGDELSSQQLMECVQVIMANNKSVDTTGANRTWIANIFVQCGVLAGNSDWIEAGREGLKDVFQYVDTGDGFHPDGSFIQHNYYAYTGGYGKALLCTLAPMMYVLGGTEYEIAYEDHCEQLFYDMIFEAYEPLIYGGRFMDMAREREISRIANQDDIPGRQAIRSIIMLADVLPAEQSERAKSMIKEWLSDEEVLKQVCIDPIGGYNEYYLPAGVISLADEIVNSGQTSRGSLVEHKRFGAMDRVVHLRDNFGFTVSMSSNRIRNTEGTNDEGLRLWHIGDGLTYLYNKDKTYYSDHYWATVDYQKLPGTTVNRVPGRAAKEGYNTNNPYKFAGGTDLGEYGIAGMELQGVGTSGRNGAHSKKSWFMFDDEVVALGSDIRSSISGSEVDTTVENRKIKLDKSNILTVDGQVQNCDTVEPYTEKNQSMKVTSVTAASGQDAVARKVFGNAEANGTIVFKCRVKMPATTDFFALKLYGNGGNDGEADSNLVFLTMRNNSLVPRIQVDGGTKDAYSSKAGLLAGQWHNVRVEMNMEDQTFNYYFDGEQITEGKSVDGNTADASLVDAQFFKSMAGNAHTLTALEVMAPGSKAGSIQIDDIEVTSNGNPVYAEDFEDCKADMQAASLEGWSAVIRDTGEGAGAKVELEQKTVIPEGQDDFNGTHENTQWIHLAGSTEDSDVGYYFPGGADVQGLRETRLGSWDQVNIYEKFTDKQERMNSFVTFWLNHGTQPSDAGYSYVILPGKSADETNAYGENPDVAILRQDDKIHAVREEKLCTTGINFFEAGKFGPFTTENPESVMYQLSEDGETMDISFADPTQTLEELTLEASLPITEIQEKDDDVSVAVKDGITVFTAANEHSPAWNAGKSFHVKVKLDSIDNMFEMCETGTLPEHWRADQADAGIAEEKDGNHVLDVKADRDTDGSVSTDIDLVRETTGSSVSFKLKVEKGDCRVKLNSGSEEEIILDSENGLPVEPGAWHQVKLKVNTEDKTCVLMVDGKVRGRKLTYRGDTPDQFVLEAVKGSHVQLDNLIVAESSVIPPTRPERLTYTGYGDTYVNLAWDASESDNPVYYRLSINGEEREELIDGNSFTVLDLSPGTEYQFQVQAVDDDENFSEISGELNVLTLEKQIDTYVIDFNDYEKNDKEQHRWEYSGSDPKGIIEIVDTPMEKADDTLDGMLTDIGYQEVDRASSSNAKATYRATSSDAENDAEYVENMSLYKATSSNAQHSSEKEDRVLYLYSGTAQSGVGKTASYSFEKQTEKKIYRLKLYLDQSTKYTNFALVGTNGKQAVTMMISDNGVIGYRDGDHVSNTVEMFGDKIEGEWIEFVIIADPVSQEFSISANGTTMENLKFRNQTQDITKLVLNAPANAIGGMYVDDIVLPGENVVQKLKLTGLEGECDNVTVPYGTDFYELELPDKLMVTVEDAEGENSGMEVKVNWNKEDYDSKKSGVQTIYGTLACPSNCVNKIPEKQIKVKVEVEKEIKKYRITLYQTAGGTISTDETVAEEGTEITVTAEPKDGYKISYWLVNNSRREADSDSCSFILEKDTTVSAAFEAEAVKPADNYYTVSAIVRGKGILKISSNYAKEGTEITLTAVPESGWELSGLKVNGKSVVTDEDLQYVFELAKNTNVQAIFKEIPAEEPEKEPEKEPEREPENSSTDSGTDGNDSSGSYEYTERYPKIPAYAVTGTWRSVDNHWEFVKSRGEKAVSEWACILWNGNYEWFYFNEKGEMKTGWMEIDGKSYYFQETSDGNRGRMLTGKHSIGGKWYYFNTISDGTKGVLWKDTVTPDGHRAGADGSWEE